MIDTGNGLMVIKRHRNRPAEDRRLVRVAADGPVREATDRQMDQLVPQMFAESERRRAKPLFILAPKDETRDETDERSRRLGVDPGVLEKK